MSDLVRGEVLFMEDKSKLFREKSVDAVSSPESLNDYLKVTSPGIWILLSSIILLLAGALVWGVYGHIDSTVSAPVISQGGEVYCLVPEEALSSVVEDPRVKVEGEEMLLAPSTLVPEIIREDTNIYIILAGHFQLGQVVYRIPAEGTLAEGIYTGSLVTERLTPLSLLMN